MSHLEHLRQSDDQRPARCAVMTVSDTRTVETDRSGRVLVDLLAAANHEAIARQIVPDEPQAIGECLDQWIADPHVQVILSSGGTGLARRDRTIEVVQQRLTQTLEGFGELFRSLSHRQIGSSAMLSRAAGGLAGETLIFAMPGSPNAVQLAMRELILPQLGHLLWLRD